MKPLPDTDSDSLPLLFLRFGNSQEAGHLLERLLLRLKKRSLSTLVLSFAEAPAGRCRLCSADTFGVAESALLAEPIVLRRRFLSEYAHRFGAEYDLLLIDAGPEDDEGEVQGVEFGRAGDGSRPFIRLRDREELAPACERLYSWLEQQVVRPPLWSCLLIGGKSLRMGRPKHLIEDRAGVAWSERLVCLLSNQSDGVVLSGAGAIPPSLSHLPRLADIEGAQGPLAGIVAAMRWKPDACWLVSACDMPLIGEAALKWLLSTRRPGIWGSVPLQPGSQRLEPLFAHYDFRARTLFERMVSAEEYRLNRIGESAKIATPPVPVEYRRSWRNCNTPEDIEDSR